MGETKLDGAERESRNREIGESKGRRRDNDKWQAFRNKTLRRGWVGY